MVLQEPNVFDQLAKPLRDAISEKGFTFPSAPQSEAIPKILAGKNVLIISPTASGKTEAAVLPILSMFVAERGDQPGIKILYITPLKALNRDMLERFEWWGTKLDVTMAVRHGDTAPRERALQAKNPPDMLITTPETLQAILTGPMMKRHLQAVRYIIIDEVHELAEDKRGSQLALALERLRWSTMRDFQVIGLSATIGTPEKVARFLVGEGRETATVHVPVGREMRLKVISPTPDLGDIELASRLYTPLEVASRLRLMRRLIEEHRSVLLFTNTRAVAEILASRMKVWDIDFPISIHHGSLAKPSRISAERGLKNGELRCLIATSSLELGIDVGSIDFVIQYMSPRQVTRLIQRVGRSGHRLGRPADGVIVALDSDDALESMVIARNALQENLEPVSIPCKPLDVLAHQLAGLLIQRGKWYLHEILEMFTRAYPYRDLTEQDLISVLTYMHSRYPKLASFFQQDSVVLRPRRLSALYSYYFGKLSTIPDAKQYLVIDQKTDEAVGVLDEAFVAEHAEQGKKFIVRGSPWLMMSIRGNKIYVKPIKDPRGSIPSWTGEQIPVPFEIAQEVGSIRRRVEEGMARDESESKLIHELCHTYPADPETMQHAVQETIEQITLGLKVPTDNCITIEDWEGLVIVSAHFGLLVNRTLAHLMAHLLSEELGQTIGVQQDPCRIVIQTSGAANANTVAQTLYRLAGMNIENILAESSKKTGLFKRRLVHVARRFGAITKFIEHGSVNLRQLMTSFEGTVIMEEALKETLEKDLDAKNTISVLQRLGKEIDVQVASKNAKISPIARSGIERINRKGDLIPPQKMKRILIDTTKVRILNEYRTLVCLKCPSYVKIKRLKDMPSDFTCPECKKGILGITAQTPEFINRIKKKRGRNLSAHEERTVEDIEGTAELLKKYGRVGAYVLTGRRIGSNEAKAVLRRTHTPSDRLFQLIIDTERRMLRRRFW